jgi:hypothetical protein
MEGNMVKIDFDINETSATDEAKDKVFNQLFIEEKARVIKSKFEKLLKNKVDIDIKAILSALNGFESYLTIPNIENDKSFYLRIEKCIKKDLELHTRSKYDIHIDGFWILYSYYVLFFINVFNRKHVIAIRYLLKTFITNSYLARTKLFPYIYDEYFESKFIKELKIRYYYIPEDPRVYTNGKASHRMMQAYIDLMACKKEEIDKFIDERCKKVAIQSFDNIGAYKTILSILSLR